MATNRARYTVSVDDKMFQQIEDFRFERRFQTRSEATVELIRLGLAALEAGQGTRPKRDVFCQVKIPGFAKKFPWYCHGNSLVIAK